MFWMGQPDMSKTYHLEREANPWTETSESTGGRETISDCASSGERTRKSPNLLVTARRGYRTAIIKFRDDMNRMGNMQPKRVRALQRKSMSSGSILSRAGSETPRLNLPAPSGKAKYYWETDSEPVLWRKGEKQLLNRRVKGEPETVRLLSGWSPVMGWQRAFA